MAPISRSENMRRIRSKDTSPEMTVRKLLHALGYRYQLHRKDLPGKPDIVFPARRKVVFVHGCFWHQHSACVDGHVPKQNLAYWGPKLHRNKVRDVESQRALEEAGWSSLVIWECEVEHGAKLQSDLVAFLGAPRQQ